MKSPFIKPILALNTATHCEEVAVIVDTKVVAQKHWVSNRNESSQLLESISAVLTKAELEFKDLGAIVTVNGPGPFSALRIGCAVSNALAYALKIPAYAITTEAFWKVRTEKLAQKEKIVTILSAGKGHFAVMNIESENALNPLASISSHHIFSLEELVQMLIATHASPTEHNGSGKALTVVCDTSLAEAELIKAALTKSCPPSWKVLTEADTKQVLPLGKTILALPEVLICCAESNIVAPRYLRPPNITPSKQRVYAT